MKYFISRYTLSFVADIMYTIKLSIFITIIIILLFTFFENTSDLNKNSHIIREVCYLSILLKPEELA